MCVGAEVAILGCGDLLYFAIKLYYVNSSRDRMFVSPTDPWIRLNNARQKSRDQRFESPH
jgi:hypothetical protein